MGDLINLNQYRKQRERAERQKQAQGNRTKYGRRNSDRVQSDHEQQKRSRELDNKLLMPPHDQDDTEDPA